MSLLRKVYEFIELTDSWPINHRIFSPDNTIQCILDNSSKITVYINHIRIIMYIATNSDLVRFNYTSFNYDIFDKVVYDCHVSDIDRCPPICLITMCDIVDNMSIVRIGDLNYTNDAYLQKKINCRIRSTVLSLRHQYTLWLCSFV